MLLLNVEQSISRKYAVAKDDKMLTALRDRKCVNFKTRVGC